MRSAHSGDLGKPNCQFKDTRITVGGTQFNEFDWLASNETLRTLEKNLNALCKAPRIHREQLLQYVHPPLIRKLEYPAPAGPHAQALESLRAVYRDLDILRDPHVLSLKAKNTHGSREELAKVLLRRKTYCQDQIKGLWHKSVHIHTELGAWATNYYIAHSIDRLRSKSDRVVIAGWGGEEKQYLSDALGRVQVAQTVADSLNDVGEVSPKLQRFIDLLVEESVPHFAGLVFIEQRAAAAVLSHLLSVHPRTKHLFECATFVGTSGSAYRKAASIGDLIEPRGQKTTLGDFRDGKKNLIIATSVLEEGIDISACHLVICFSKPQNLKSFVQRRGRARAKQSKFVLMLMENDRKNAVDRWQELEEDMKNMYLDDQRKLEEVGRMESTVEEGARRFLVESTGYAVSCFHTYCCFPNVLLVPCSR
jgi:ERCC4-related helicase